MTKVRVGIIGCGGMAGAHAQRFSKNRDVEIVGLCDVSEAIVDGYIGRVLADYEPRPKVFTTPVALYADVRPDAVAIVTPHTMHFEHGMEALEHGCHVLMEKPMVTRAEDAYALADAARQSGRVFVIAYNTPCTAEFHYLRELIRGDELGRLELVSGWLVQDWYALTINSWRQNPDLSGGGQAYDSGAHLLNSLCWTVEAPVAEVYAFIDRKSSKVDINSAINIRFENGVLATMIVGGNCPAGGSRMMYGFEEGRVEIDGWSGGWIDIHQRGGRVKYPPITESHQTPNDNFIDAILGRAQPRTSPDNGVIQSELMDAIYESARTGRPASPKARQPSA